MPHSRGPLHDQVPAPSISGMTASRHQPGDDWLSEAAAGVFRGAAESCIKCLHDILHTEQYQQPSPTWVAPTGDMYVQAILASWQCNKQEQWLVSLLQQAFLHTPGIFLVQYLQVLQVKVYCVIFSPAVIVFVL